MVRPNLLGMTSPGRVGARTSTAVDMSPDTVRLAFTTPSRPALLRSACSLPSRRLGVPFPGRWRLCRPASGPVADPQARPGLCRPDFQAAAEEVVRR